MQNKFLNPWCFGCKVNRIREPALGSLMLYCKMNIQNIDYSLESGVNIQNTGYFLESGVIR